MNKEEQIPLYSYDDFDHKLQEEWLKKKNDQEKKNNQRGAEVIELDISKDLLI